jgi:hypothetical protein
MVPVPVLPVEAVFPAPLPAEAVPPTALPARAAPLVRPALALDLPDPVPLFPPASGPAAFSPFPLP